MGFKPPSENDIKDIKKRLISTIETIDKVERFSCDIKSVVTGNQITMTGTSAMKINIIKIELIAYTEEYPNPELKKE